MFYKTIFATILFIALVGSSQAQEGADLYHDNGTIAFDSSYHSIYYNNKQSVYNQRFKRYYYKNGKKIYEPGYKNIYYSDGNIAYNGMFKKVYYNNGLLAYDNKKKIVYDKNGAPVHNFTTSGNKQYTVHEEFLSVTIIPDKDFEFELKLTEENFIYTTDFKSYFKIMKRNSNDNSDEIFRTLKLK
ncbi:MAG: hypothetical protein U9N85_02670 [Bacteroidota bacterium]|nr:hypothetical protein [Bacteroidota bacterium]